MKAVVYERYGPPEVMELSEVDKPVAGEHELVIRVVAVSLNRSDWESLVGSPAYARTGGLTRPRNKILGTDVAGVVESVGVGVEKFQPGDEVFGDLMYHGGKGLAEFVKTSDKAPLLIKPPDIDFATAATLPQAGVIALQGVEGRVDSGDEVLINGAGGGTGVFAIQLAKHAGARVTGVDNEAKQEFIIEMGADEAFDYTKTDYTRSGKYDLILDLVCVRSMFAIRRAVAPGGRYSVVGGSVPAMLSALTVGRIISTKGRRMGVLMVQPRVSDLARIVGLVDAGVLRPSVERVYKLEEAPDALAHMGGGHALGKLVIEIG